MHKVDAVNSSLTVEIGPERVLTDGAYQPFLFQTSTGDLLANGWLSIRGDHKDNRFPGIGRWLVSHDGAVTWQDIAVPKSEETGLPYLGAGVELPDGRYVMLYYYAWRDGGGSGPYTGELWSSRDGFRTFEGPTTIRVNVPDSIPNYDDCGLFVDIVVFHRSLIALPDGSLLASAYARFVGDDTPCPYLPTMMKCRSILLVSRDEGLTWDYMSTVAYDPEIGQEGHNETSIVRLTQGPRSGRLLCWMRTGSAGDPIYETFSDDDGMTWSEPCQTEALGVDPCLLELSDGTLACSWGTRLHDVSGFINNECVDQSPTYKVMFSRDGGTSWTNPVEVPLKSPATGMDCNTGYSALAELEPGKVLLVYDLGSFDTEKQYLASRVVSI